MNQEVPVTIPERGPTSSAIGNRALGSIERADDLVGPPERVAGLLDPAQVDG